MDDDFVQGFMTHLSRVTRTIEKDTEFCITLASMAKTEPQLEPLVTTYLGIAENRLEAFTLLASDIGIMMSFSAKLIAAALSASQVPPPTLGKNTY